MADERVSIVETFSPSQIVAEQASGGDVLLPIKPEVIEAIRAEDSDPKFATFVIEEGFSLNKRLWGKPVFQSVQEQITSANEGDDPIVGYLGHISPEQDHYAFPDIQFQWLASKLGNIRGKAAIFTKAYVLPDTKARFYLGRKLARHVSWRGDALQIPIKGGSEVKDFVLESIDLARPRRAGMSARLVGALTSEMQTEDHTVKPEEIAVLQENELRAHAPALVKTVEDAARKPLEEKVAEMEQKDEAAKPVLDFIPQLRATLGLADDASPLDVLKAGYEEIRKAGKSVRDSLLSEILEKKFGKERDPLVDRILTAEMSPDFRPTGKKDDDYKKVEEMVNSIVDGDEALKEKVSEMQGTPTAPAITGKDRGGKKKVEPGYESTGLRVRSA